MNIIAINARENGGRPQIQNWDTETPPEGYVFIPDDMAESATAVFVENKGFVNITHDDTYLLTIAGNQVALDAAFPPPSAEELLAQARSAALERIDGKCSAAIASGVDYGEKHYSLTPTKQGYINNAYLEVLGGAEQVKLAADGEDVTWHTAAQITELFTKATAWGKVCIYYKGYLVAWIEVETDTAVLEAADYGSTLPAAYMQALTAKLSEENIAMADFADKLSA